MPSDTAGLTLDGSGSSPSIADTGGAGTGGFSSWSKSKKTAAAVGGFLVLAGGAFLLARHKSSSASTATTATTVTGATNSETGGVDSNQQSLLAGLLGIGTGVTNLANSLSTMKAANDTINNYYTTNNTTTEGIAPSSNSSQSAPSSVGLPGYASGAGELFTNNPSLAGAQNGGSNVPGITGYQVEYNGVPI